MGILSTREIAWGNAVRAIHAVHQNENLVSEVGTKMFLEVSQFIWKNVCSRQWELRAQKHRGVKHCGEWEERTSYSEFLQ